MISMPVSVARAARVGARPSAVRSAARTQLLCSAMHRPASQPAAAASQRSVEKAALALALALAPIAPLAANAEDAAAALDSVTQAAPSTTFLGFTPLGLALSISPVLLYGAFYLYREKVNPKAKLVDLLFFVAATVIIGNIVSILVFKKRVY